MCHMLKWRGVAIASTLLVGMLAYNLSHQPAVLWPWTIVLALCAATTFVVTVLCCEESSENWDSLSKEVDDSKQTISHLSDIVAVGNKKLMHEKSEAIHHSDQLKARVQELQDKLSSSEQAFKMAHGEVAAAVEQQKKVESEFAASKSKWSSLSLEFAKQLTEHKDALTRLVAQLASMKEEKASLEDQLQQQGLYRELIEQLKDEKMSLSDQTAVLEKDLIKTQTLLEEQSLQLAEALAAIEQLKSEKEALAIAAEPDREVRRVTGLYQQLRLQFDEKSNTLAATRRELFETQEKLLATQKDLEETKLYEETEAHTLMRRLLDEAESELQSKEHEAIQLHALVDSLMSQ